MIENMYVLYENIMSDHIPFAFTVNIECAPEVVQCSKETFRSKLDSDKVNERGKNKYTNESEIMLRNCHVPTEALLCKSDNCQNVNHNKLITRFYEDIVGALNSAGQNLLKTSRTRCKNHNRPGWAEYCSDLYDNAREVYLEWLANGKPRNGQLFGLKNRTRARFKGALRFIKSHENALRKESLAKKMLNKSSKDFWKEIKNINNSKISLPDVIQDVQGEENIARMCRSHYKDLFNCLKDPRDTKALCNKVEFSTAMIITPVEVREAIKNLECNKSCGKDGIHAEHLKYSSCRVIQMLSMALTGFLIHGFLPPSMISVVLIPIIKNKNKRICDKTNYRPIALASIM